VHGAEDTREKILRAAMEVFAAHGIFTAPLHLVAKKAGVSKALIFWYFHSRDELVREIILRVLPTDVARKCIEKGLGGKELLVCIGRSYFEKYSDPVMRQLLIQVMAARTVIDYVDKAFEEFCHGYLREIARRVWGSDGREERTRARMFFGSLLCYTLNPPRDIEPSEYLESVVKVLVGEKE